MVAIGLENVRLLETPLHLSAYGDWLPSHVRRPSPTRQASRRRSLNDFATSARDRSDERYNSTASRRNSSGYFTGRPILGVLPLDYIQDQVSNNAGQLQKVVDRLLALRYVPRIGWAGVQLAAPIMPIRDPCVSNRGYEMEVKRIARQAASVGVAASSIAMLIGQAQPASAREALSGQCGVDEVKISYTISADSSLSATISGTGKSRTARFRFYGGDSGSNYYWDRYAYRYAVTATNFRPQSNENVRFGAQRNSPDDAYWSQYDSPDNHNSNVGNPVPIQYMGANYLSPGGNTEIWTRAIFDVPNVSDPSCWISAIATK